MQPDKEIRLAHGNGGRLTHRLIEELVLPILGNPLLNRLNDSAIVDVSSSRLAFTTDSYVVDPLFFPGGDIGRLAVCGTVNDLAVAGAKPLCISLGMIIEEGFSMVDLKRVLVSMQQASREADVCVVTGDTKVVPKGKADRLFVNTSGIGILIQEGSLVEARAKVGDRILLSGPLGRHGMAILSSREDFGFKTRISSDVAPLNGLVAAMLETSDCIHVMRDATRGGLSSVLNELATQSGFGIEIEESSLPVPEDVQGACELLGLDPLVLANEGVLVAAVDPRDSRAVLDSMKRVPVGKGSVEIGEVVKDPKGRVVMKTRLGSRRFLDMLSGELLPRIC